jgi:hypothetical protein
LFPLLLASGTAFVLLWGRKIIEQILSKIPQVGLFAWNDLQRLTINQVANGIYLRLTSLQAMAGSVFMKRIRSMGFRFIYQQYKGKNRQKLIANLIYELKTGAAFPQLPVVEPPSQQLLKVIDDAANMPTTLWFTQDNQLDNLIICAQATTCYNLMVYITRNHGDDVNSFPPKVHSLWEQLVADWNSLSSDPRILSSKL